MITRLYEEKDLVFENVREDIKETFLNGRNVVFPTETVYGIGANIFSAKGITGVYNLKGRPSDNPLILHLSKEEDVYPYIKTLQPYAKKLMDHFWPGPLTLVIKKSDVVPSTITGGLDTVGIRVPASQIAREIIDIAGVPICAPSANISGRPSSTLFEHVLEDFQDRVDIIINGGKSQIGLESTVVDVTGDTPIVLRPGMITSDMIKSIVGRVAIRQQISQIEIPTAPGMKYKHYAPTGKLLIVEGPTEKVVEYINQKVAKLKKAGYRVGVIATEETKVLFKCDFVSIVGKEHKELEIASNLFAVLREMDKLKIDYIFSLSFETGDFAEAIMNRLNKAADQNTIKL